MVAVLPKLRVGDPIRHEALSVFPLYWESNNSIDYRVSDEALADQSVVVEEISEGGSVPQLSVENKGDTRVLFLEGEQLVGAKQNRILNTTVLIGAHTKIKIPVSCVEQGRWRYKSRYFGASGAQSPGKVRQALKKSVARSIKDKLGHMSDQGRIWQEVQYLQVAHHVESETSALSDAFDKHQSVIDSYRDNLKYIEHASGMAVALGAKIVCFDLFDKPSTCQKVWNRLLSGFVFDAINEKQADQPPTVGDVENWLAAANDMKWEPAPAVGGGEEFRAESNNGEHASALVYDGTMIHGNVLTAF